MSGSDSGPGRREVAYRLFAAEFDDASLSYSESDEERAPNYVVTPTGLRVNRLFAVGVLTEVEAINEETLRGRIVDPTGAFVTYAGQYQPEAQAFLDRTTPPAFVAITGKARTFEPEDSDRVFTSVRPESLSEVDADTRDRWVVSAAEATLHRVAVCAAALDSSLRGEELQAALAEAGVDDSLAAGIPRALDHYGTTTAYLDGLRRLAVEALELVADDREEVQSLDLAPDEGGETALGPLPAVDLDLSAGVAPTAESTGEAATDAASTENAASTASTEPETDVGQESAATATDEPTDTSVDESEPSTSATSDGDGERDTEPAPETANGAADAAASTASDSAAGSEPDADDGTDSADEPGLYQLDDEEREAIESEYGTDFSSGNEVDPAGEADIDVPDADELAERAESETEADVSTEEPEPTPEAESSTDESGTLGDFDDGLGEFQDDTEPTTDSSTDDSAAEPSEA
ncbi:MAG: hypothetical protein ACOC0Z_00560, partial [Halohasta sp.]